MSYCVHCGVELADSESICPLCGTKVIDPSRLTADSIPAFPSEEDHKPVNHRFAAKLISIFLIIPVLVTVIIDIFTVGGLTWSLYVMSGVLYIWSFVVVPIAWPNLSPHVHIGVAGLSTALFLLAIHIATGASGWYLPLALPIVLATVAAIELAAAVIRNKKMNVIRRGGLLFILLALLTTAIDLILNHHITWSVYVAIPVVSLGMALFGVSYNRRICDWMRRNLFI